MPAKEGIQNYLKTLDSRLRGNDAEGRFKTFYETINVEHRVLMALRFIYFKTNEPQNTESQPATSRSTLSSKPKGSAVSNTEPENPPEADKFRMVESLPQRRRLRRTLLSIF